MAVLIWLQMTADRETGSQTTESNSASEDDDVRDKKEDKN